LDGTLGTVAVVVIANAVAVRSCCLSSLMGAGPEVLLLDAGVRPLVESLSALEVVGVGDWSVWWSAEDGP
jgi:hypothetical protein